MDKFAIVGKPLPEVGDHKLNLIKFTEFKEGDNLVYWLQVLRMEFINCNVADDGAFLIVPKLIEGNRNRQWAQTMIGEKALRWSEIVKCLVAKFHDFSESSKGLRRLETII